MSSSSIKAIKTNEAPAPVGPYNQAIIVENWLYCSGQIALDPQTNEMVGKNDVVSETRQIMSNLEAVLYAAGSSFKQVIKTTIYLVDLGDFEKVNQVYAESFKESTSPARACVQVAALPKGGRVEIDCIAWLG